MLIVYFVGKFWCISATLRAILLKQSYFCYSCYCLIFFSDFSTVFLDPSNFQLPRSSKSYNTLKPEEKNFTVSTNWING